MKKRKHPIESYKDLPDRLKPLGVLPGLSTIDEVENTILSHQGTVSYKDNDHNNQEIYYLFVSGVAGLFRLPSPVSEVRFSFFRGILFDILLIFELKDELDFHRILRSLKKLYGYPKVDLRFGKWDYPAFWISFREDKDEEQLVLEYADREMLNQVQNIIKQEKI